MGGNTNRFRGRRLVAVLGALALGLGGAVGAATTASAADDFGNIDMGRTGSILIHKHVHQSGTTETASPDGTKNISSAAVAGVTFTAFPITSLNLSLAGAWTTVSTLNVPATACDGSTPTLTGQTLGSGLVSPATDSSGRATISAPVAAYLVCETAQPSTVVDKAQPFVVTIPYSYKRATGTPIESWLYDVNVYPKNGLASISKSVTAPTSLGLGATATFPVTTDIPMTASNAIFTHYWVQDPMDSRFAMATVSTVTVGTTPVTASHYSVSTTANKVTLQFTSAGLTWLKSQAGKQLVTTFTGTVSSLGTGVIDNTASFSVATKVGTGPVTPDDPGTTYAARQSAPVTQNWGDLAVRKVDAGSSTTGLVGAEFEVYATATQDAACTSITPTGSAISVSGAMRFTTGSNGLLLIAGLFVSDSQNAPVAAAQRCYVLKEVTAPSGFILPVSPYSAVAVRTGVTNTAVAYDASIPNTRITGVVLPMTGSNGIVVLSVAGLALIAAGIVLAFLARRRRQAA